MKKHKYLIAVGIGCLFIWAGIAISTFVSWPKLLIATGIGILICTFVVATESD